MTWSLLLDWTRRFEPVWELIQAEHYNARKRLPLPFIKREIQVDFVNEAGVYCRRVVVGFCPVFLWLAGIESFY